MTINEKSEDGVPKHHFPMPASIAAFSKKPCPNAKQGSAKRGVLDMWSDGGPIGIASAQGVASDHDGEAFRIRIRVSHDPIVVESRSHCSGGVIMDCRKQMSRSGFPYSFSELLAHVCKVISDDLRHPDEYSPSFYGTRVIPTLGSLSSRDRRIATRLQDTLAHFETSLAYDVAGLFLVTGPPGPGPETFTNEARYFYLRGCRAIEEARRQEQVFLLGKKKGGRLRQASLHPVIEKLGDILRAYAPVEGWPNESKALEVALPIVKEFIRDGRFSMSVGTNLRRTLRTWILADPKLVALCNVSPDALG